MYPIFEVTNADVAFPTAAHIPKENEIPAEFWGGPGGNTKWNKCFNDWFYCGIKTEQLTPKTGIDATKAIRAIKSIMGSYAPKHEHKEAACAYLLSEWFSDYIPLTKEEMTAKLGLKLKGFTLIELIIFVALFMIVAAVIMKCLLLSPYN